MSSSEPLREEGMLCELPLGDTTDGSNTSGSDLANLETAACIKIANQQVLDEIPEKFHQSAICQATTTGNLDPMPTTPTHHRANSDISNSNRKKRLCRFPGCTKVIKSQGHCQRHGAKAKRCKVDGCEKQAQGTHNGMCKRHWRAVHFPDQVAAKAEAAKRKEMEEQPPPPVGESVYDTILPTSIAYRPSTISAAAVEKNLNATNVARESNSAQVLTPVLSSKSEEVVDPAKSAGTAVATTNNSNTSSSNNSSSTAIVSAMPLVTFLRFGALHKEVGWHRQEERRARGIFPCASLSSQLEAWEKQLALVEILLLSGGTPHANFKDLAHAWGRERNFHQVISSSVCTRRGEVDRKRRSDAGKKNTAAAVPAAKSPAPPSAAGLPHQKRPKFTTPTNTTLQYQHQGQLEPPPQHTPSQEQQPLQFHSLPQQVPVQYQPPIVPIQQAFATTTTPGVDHGKGRPRK